MEAIFSQLGVNWRLLLTQGVNFFVLAAILTLLVYRPLTRIMEERRRKIESGVKAGEEAERRLTQIEELKARRMAEAERSAVSVISRAEEKAKKQGGIIIAGSEEKAKKIIDEARDLTEKKRIEELENLAREARGLVRAAIVKTVELDPVLIDEKLVERAIEIIKKQI